MSQRNFAKRVREAIQRRLLPAPFHARHTMYSMLFSEDDASSSPSERLLDLSLDAIRCARQLDLGDIVQRLEGRFRFPDCTINLWPGEHYRLLAALVHVLRPKSVLEIGTAEGISALALLQQLPPEGQVITFDIVPWQQYPCSCLTARDFHSGRLRQIVADLGDPHQWAECSDILSNSDLIFIDAAKDGVLERKILENFSTKPFETRPILLLDDIRMWSMLKTWRQMQLPKLDLTSFGHWCGTGLCEWTGLPVFGSNDKGRAR